VKRIKLGYSMVGSAMGGNSILVLTKRKEKQENYTYMTHIKVKPDLASHAASIAVH
jgi:hypothetical protein